MDARPESFSVLTVCDGNVCRSPSAQFELALRLPEARVESAGIHAPVGAGLCTIVAGAIAAEGAEAVGFTSEFRSRSVEGVNLERFDLVLTATSSIRSDLARAHPRLRDRFFTFREAAAVLVAIDSADLPPGPLDPPALVAAMNRHRGVGPIGVDLPPRLRRRVLDPLDIPDAHRLRGKRHRAVVDLSRSAAASVGDSLARLRSR